MARGTDKTPLHLLGIKLCYTYTNSVSLQGGGREVGGKEGRGNGGREVRGSEFRSREEGG